MVQGFLNRSQTDLKKALGPSSEEILAEENQKVREAQQRLKEAEKTETRRKDCLTQTNSSK